MACRLQTPPLFLGRDRLKICFTSDRLRRYSGPVRLENAIEEYLSLYVADAIFQYFRDAWDIDFHSDPADEFPAPQDPRLHALLAMAGSPSTRKVPMANPFRDSFFGTVMLNIRTYMDVHKSRLLHKNFPSFKLDGNRYSVLKLLYTLITSDEFSGASMRILDQRITLVTFLRVLHSTSPRPRFLPEDWCTPSMASNFSKLLLRPGHPRRRIIRTHSLFLVVPPRRESDFLSFCFWVSSRPDRQAPR